MYIIFKIFYSYLLSYILHQKYKYVKYLQNSYNYDIINKMAFNALMGDFYGISA